MARGKNLTYKMKKYVSGKMKLNADDWTYVKNTLEEFVLVNKIERNITSF